MTNEQKFLKVLGNLSPGVDIVVSAYSESNDCTCIQIFDEDSETRYDAYITGSGEVIQFDESSTAEEDED